MRHLVIFICLILICLNGCAGNKDVQENPLRIKSAVVEIDGEETFIQYQYNDKGILQQETETVNGEHHYSVSYEYDSFGNTIRKTTLYSDGTTSITEYFLTLDEENRVIYRETYFDTELTDCFKITYDKKGNEINHTSTIIKPGKDQVVTSEMTYDSHENLTKKVVQWSNDPSRGGTTTYFYDKGRLTREEFQAPAGWVKSYIEYSYDDSGLIQTAMEYNGNGSLQSKTVTMFDEYGNILRYEYYRHSSDIPGSGDDIADRIVVNTYEKIDLEG